MNTETGKEAAEAFQGNDGKSTATKRQSKGSVMTQIITVGKTTDKDWNGHTVTTPAGLQIVPGSIIMDALSSADNHTHTVDRSRFMTGAA